MNDDTCTECGASVVGGRDGCQATFDEFAARAFTDIRYAAEYQLAFDTYCMQHVEPYCRSAKSYAAHLMRLCCGLEHAGDPKIYAAIQLWLSGSVDIERPETLVFRGKVTVVDVMAASSIEAYKVLVRDWANCVWAAYASQHDDAHH